MRRIENESMLRELHNRGHGLIYNDYSGTGPSGGQYNVLHAASCRWILQSNARIPKYHFPSLAEAERWLGQNRGQEGIGWKRCGSCRAQVAEVVARGYHEPSEPPAESVPAQLELDLQQASGPSYLVRSQVTESGVEVEAWSKRRLPFEPKGWLVAFRDELRKAVRQLKATPQQLLQATYASKQEDFFDVENVLFYNLGSSALKQAGRYGVQYERAYQAPVGPSSPSWPTLHYHNYRLHTGPTAFTHWREGALLAKFQVTTTQVSDLTDCTRVWMLLKRSERVESMRLAAGEPFILRVMITAPARERLVAVYLLKPIIDGIVSAFHCHNGQDIEELCRRLAARTQNDASTLRSYLNDDAHAVLGARRLLWLYRSGVQWNPADELCMAAQLRINYVALQTNIFIRGELFSTRYRGADI